MHLSADVSVAICADDESQIPVYSRNGDAAVDLRASEPVVLEPHGRALVPTGIRIALPEGFAGLVLPRSGLAINSGVTVLNAPGLIDENYRGEVKVVLYNSADEPFSVQRGDRIAQLMVVPVPKIRFHRVAELDDTERGSDGFGSSGLGAVTKTSISMT